MELSGRIYTYLKKGYREKLFNSKPFLRQQVLGLYRCMQYLCSKVALVLCSPIDGVARIFFLFVLGTLDHAIYRAWFHLSSTTADWRGTKIIWILQNQNANGGNQTQAASKASENAIHYTTRVHEKWFLVSIPETTRTLETRTIYSNELCVSAHLK